MKILRIFLILFIGLMVLSACRAEKVRSTDLNIMVHDSFSASEDVIVGFEDTNNVHLNFIWSGDTGALVNRAILAKNAPLADVLYGVDNTFLSRALEADIFEPYRSPLLADINPDYILDPTLNVLPVDYGDVCLNYDRAYFASKKLAVPKTLEDLTNPIYKGLLVVQNPATSSPGLAFLLATVAQYGSDKYLDYWKRLKANGVVVVNDWETAYYSYFSGSSGKGAQPMVVSYSTSPAAEQYFSKSPMVDAPTEAITSAGMCFRQVEFAGILKGTAKRPMAQKFIDFLLDKRFQEDMPLQMFVYPVNKTAELPYVIGDYSKPAEKPAAINSVQIAKNRDAWIQAWNDVVLK